MLHHNRVGRRTLLQLMKAVSPHMAALRADRPAERQDLDIEVSTPRVLDPPPSCIPTLGT
jgi:hypothetical protein